MAKVLENRMVVAIEAYRKFMPEVKVFRCGCGREAHWEVYGPGGYHCDDCLSDAIATNEFVKVRQMQAPIPGPYGGFDDAS